MHTAIILAAGRGSRLRPLTDITPKALCNIKEVPLIEHHINHLVDAGFSTIIINHAYLGDQIRRRLGHGTTWGISIVYSPEPPGALETGGGIFNMITRFNLEHYFACINADIYCDYPLSNLANLANVPPHSTTQNDRCVNDMTTHWLAHLVLIHNPPYKTKGDFGLKDGYVSLDNKQYTYSGIAVYHPSLFKACLPGRFSVIDIIKRHLSQRLVRGEVYSGQWFDIGNQKQYLEAVSTKAFTKT